MILHLYIARRFLRAFAMVFAVFLAILLPIDLAEQLRFLGHGDAGTGAAGRLALLNLPGALYQMLPLFIILATLVLFLGLARTSELVVIRASGRSALKSTIVACRGRAWYRASGAGRDQPAGRGNRKAI